jgi:hypothetical protein
MKLKSIPGALLAFMMASSQLEAEEIELALTCARIAPSESQANEVYHIFIAKDKIMMPANIGNRPSSMPVLGEEEFKAVIIAINNLVWSWGAEVYMAERTISVNPNYSNLDHSYYGWDQFEIDRTTGVWNTKGKGSDFQCDKISNDPAAKLEVIKSRIRADISKIVKDAESEKAAADAVVNKF